MRAILCAVLALVVCIGDASAEHEGKTLADMLKQGAETKPFENAETFTLNAAINTDTV